MIMSEDDRRRRKRRRPRSPKTSCCCCCCRRRRAASRTAILFAAFVLSIVADQRNLLSYAQTALRKKGQKKGGQQTRRRRGNKMKVMMMTTMSMSMDATNNKNRMKPSPSSSLSSSTNNRQKKKRGNNGSSDINKKGRGGGSRKWTLHRLDRARYPLATCLDGTQGVYYVRPGAGVGRRKVFVHLEGGGWCGAVGRDTYTRYGETNSDALVPACGSKFYDCAYRATTNLGSSKFDTGEKKFAVQSGRFSTDRKINPAFWDWTHVYVRYCDGGMFSGRRKDAIPDPSTRYKVAQ